MTTIEPAQKRLILKNNLQLERDRNFSVKVIDEIDGAVVALVPQSDWQKTADFFAAIAKADPRAL